MFFFGYAKMGMPVGGAPVGGAGPINPSKRFPLPAAERPKGSEIPVISLKRIGLAFKMSPLGCSGPRDPSQRSPLPAAERPKRSEIPVISLKRIGLAFKIPHKESDLALKCPPSPPAKKMERAAALQSLPPLYELKL